MKKMCVIILLFVLSLACGAAFAAEADPPDAEERAMLEAMRKEPPLNQKDIDIFIKLAPDIEKYENDEKALAKLITDAGIPLQRFQYAGAKLGVGILMLMMPEVMTREKILESGETPEFMIPGDDELKLIEKNMDVIKALMQAQEQN